MTKHSNKLVDVPMHTVNTRISPGIPKIKADVSCSLSASRSTRRLNFGSIFYSLENTTA